MSDVSQTDILDILRQDYQNFPYHQTYSIYAPDVYFKDPMNEFRGCDRYQRMIGLIQTLFRDPRLELHQIQLNGQQIRTDWTLNLTAPFPWNPRLRIDGWSELALNDQNLITTHIDYWRCSRIEMLRQFFMGQLKTQ